MYAKRIQIANCGAIEHIDITFPFNGENPKPILLVGENGSGKSILLSHIVNLLMAAQGEIYPKNSEVEQGKVYKIRSPLYISPNSEYYWGRVDFEENLYCEEIVLNHKKDEGSKMPAGIAAGTDGTRMWDKISSGNFDFYDHNLNQPNHKKTVEEKFDNNCILYFPPNRFEEPAWLNEENLKNKAEYMTFKRISGYTDRKIINYSPLYDNQNWLFGVLYDRHIFEMLITHHSIPIKNQNDESTHFDLEVFRGYKGKATDIYKIVLVLVQQIFRSDGNLHFDIGRRQNRTVFLVRDGKALIPNIFHLSSGETSLLNLFLSILRDFDLSLASSESFTKAEDVRGIVVVDEIDLHLHAIHQYEVLPKLVKMFPRVQFIVTTHSPLFVLGMEKTFGQEGFGLYKMPQGQQIDPEEFSEFGNAYQSFTKTKQFLNDMQQAVKNTQKPIVFMEGETDIKYLQKAAELLDKKKMIEKIQIKNGEGFGNLNKIWKNFDSELAGMIPQKVILLYDCDKPKDKNKGQVFMRSIRKQENHPLQKGIENLFDEKALDKARESKRAFIDIEGKHEDIKRGEDENIPEKWSVNSDEKTNLCEWFCQNGTALDFKHFQVIFDLLQEIIFNDQAVVASKPTNQPVRPN